MWGQVVFAVRSPGETEAAFQWVLKTKIVAPNDYLVFLHVIRPGKAGQKHKHKAEQFNQLPYAAIRHDIHQTTVVMEPGTGPTIVIIVFSMPTKACH